MVVINGWRAGTAGPERAWKTERDIAIHAASCTRVLDTLAFRLTPDLPNSELHSRVVRDLGATFDGLSLTQPDSVACEAGTQAFFFDGGSYGNLGQGEPNAHVTGRVIILWSASIRHAHPATTNTKLSIKDTARDYNLPIKTSDKQLPPCNGDRNEAAFVLPD